MNRIAIVATLIAGAIPAGSFAAPAPVNTMTIMQSHCDRVIITTEDGTATRESCDYYPDGHV